MFRTLASPVDLHFNKQSQFELFPLSGKDARPADQPKQRFFLRAFTLSLESLVVIGIILVMTLVVSYSIGIETGKKQSRVAMSRSSKKAAVQKPIAVVNPVPVQTAPGTSAKPAPLAVPAVTDSATIVAAKSSPFLILEKIQDPTVIRASLANEIEKFYTVQVASYKDVKFAQKEADSLKKKGYDILVLPKGSFSIVCVGKFNQKEQAKTFSQKLKKQYKDCLVRSL